MGPILVLIPEQKIIDEVFKIRDFIVSNNWGGADPRIDTFPHVSLVYSNLEVGDLNQIITDCKINFTDDISIRLEISKFESWENKISAMFNPISIAKLAEEAAKIFERNGLLDKTTRPSEIGDHMKIARHLYEDRIDEVVDYLKQNFPKRVLFNRIALIDYACTEKDIFWDIKLDKD